MAWPTEYWRRGRRVVSCLLLSAAMGIAGGLILGSLEAGLVCGFLIFIALLVCENLNLLGRGR